MSRTPEAFSRVKIDALLNDAGWNLTDGASVAFEHVLPDGSRADYALCNRAGVPVAAVEAKRASINPIAAQDQGRHYAEQLGVPFVFPVERRGNLVPGPRDGRPRGSTSRPKKAASCSWHTAARPQDKSASACRNPDTSPASTTPPPIRGRPAMRRMR